MNEKLSTKILDADQESKLISNFNPAVYENIDDSQIKTVIALMLQSVDELTTDLSNVARESGYDSICNAIKVRNEIVKILTNILSSRSSDADVDNKSLVKITRDEQRVFEDEDGSHVETTETQVGGEIIFEHEVSYTIFSVSEYNELANTNLDEETFFYNVVCKLHDCGLDCVLVYGKRRLHEFDSDVALDIIEKNRQWHTLLNNISIDKKQLNKNLPGNDHFQELISGLFIKKENALKKPKVATSRQLSLFDCDYEEVNVLPEGDIIDE